MVRVPIDPSVTDDVGLTIVGESIQKLKQKNREVFLPLSHPPGEARVDYGFADICLNGEQPKVALFVMTLPYSDAIFVQAFPRECTESFLEVHKRAFKYFGGVPTRISYDNSKIATIFRGISFYQNQWAKWSTLTCALRVRSK